MKNVLFITTILFTASLSTAFADEKKDLYSFEEKMLIEISISKCAMTIYKVLENEVRTYVTEFPVTTSRKGLKKYPTGKGCVTLVVLNPCWYPTNETVAYINKKMAARGKKPILRKGEKIKPGDPRNAMGTFKMLLSHSVPGKAKVYRIHGTNNPSSIGKRESGGCIRMNDDDGFNLAKNIKERLAKKETVEVYIEK